jgi:hypothetical protein
VTNWDLGVGKAIKNFEERKRVYPSEFSLLLIDYLVKNNPADIQFLYKFLSSDFIETTIGHVTTAIPDFVEAWKKARIS